MTNAGYAENAYTVAAGANPNLSAPAVGGLNALAKQSAPAASGKSSEADNYEALGKGFGSTIGK